MKKNDELIALCQRLTSDGQLSSEEVWILASWLNEHPDACESWPGDVLSRTLQAVFEDGEIDLEEMHQVAELLVDIEKDCASQGTQEVGQTVEPEPPTRSISPEDDENLLRLPSIETDAEVSVTGRSRHQVNLRENSCTCADWTKSRRHHPAGHLGRACKHIVEQILSRPEGRCLNPVLLGILNDCRWRSRGTNAFDHYIPVLVNGKVVVVAYHEGEWVNVYAPVGRNYGRFGYHRLERRWSHGIAPKDSRAIQKAIHDEIRFGV